MNKNQTLVIIAMALFIAMTAPPGNSVTVTGNNSIYTFYVQNCTTDTINLTCAATNIKYECNITPSSLIDSVQFQIESVYYNTTQNFTSTDYWYYTYTKTQDFSDTTDPISLERQKIYDVNAGYVIAYETINIPRTCDVCEATFTQNCTTCNTSDQKYCTYTSSNESCNPSYNQTETCNYCTPNWVARTGGIYDCQPNSTKFAFYDDFNTCYSQTLLPSDAPPADHNTTQPCSYYQGDFNCTLDPQPYFTKKMNILCELPSNVQFSCNTYVKKNVTSSVLLQSNPEYSNRPASLLGLFESETRTAFQNNGKNLNAYFTNKNLEVENTFVVGVMCSDNTTTMIWEQEINPTYKQPTWVLNRYVWIKDNAIYLIMGFLIILIIIGLIAYLISQWKHGVRQ